jgi:chemotaxis protein MotA
LSGDIGVDVSTIIGLILGSVLIILAILLGGDLVAYLNAPSVLIVVGGATAATMTAYPLARFLKLPKVAMKTIFTKPVAPATLIKQLVELAEIARRDGILALENMTDQVEDEFLVRGIQMAVDGTDPEVIQQIMETDLENLMERHEAGKGLLDALGRFAPAFGMIGTLIGLVAMLSNMDDPSKIGAGMAAALLTTLYGALLANIAFLPLADKLAVRSSEEVLAKTIIIQGVMAIQAGDNPRNVQSKLMTFVPPTQRFDEDDGRAAA